MDEFDIYSTQMDTFCVSHDMDEYDLYGEIMEGSDEPESDILFE